MIASSVRSSDADIKAMRSSDPLIHHCVARTGISIWLSRSAAEIALAFGT